jgi:hypothetical protein
MWMTEREQRLDQAASFPAWRLLQPVEYVARWEGA